MSWLEILLIVNILFSAFMYWNLIYVVRCIVMLTNAVFQLEQAEQQRKINELYGR